MRAHAAGVKIFGADKWEKLTIEKKKENMNRDRG